MRRPREVVALALMMLVGTLGCVLAVAHPLSPRSPVVLEAVLAGVGVAATVLLWAFPRRAALHAGMVLSLLCTGTLVSQSVTAVGSATTSFSFVWIALYAAVFFRRSVARGYAAAAALIMGGALVANPYAGALQTYVMTAFTLTVASEVLGFHVSQLHEASSTDPLTGALNRSGLDAAAHRLFATAARTGSTVAVAVLDLDGFKAVNDARGHAAGDTVLKEFTAALRAELRETDVLARPGGDEFVVLLPGSDSRHVDTLARRVRRHCDVAWSFGAVTTYGDEPLLDVVRRADEVLYRDKAVRRSAPLPTQRASSEAVDRATL